MSDENSAPDLSAVPTGQVVMEPTFIQRLAINKPRTARALAIIGAVGTTAAAVLLTRTIQGNRHHVDAAKEHMLEAGHEAVAAVDPSSQETTTA